MSPDDICAICAWRKDCRKKFSVSGRDLHCPDFCRDVSAEEEESDASPGNVDEGKEEEKKRHP